MPLRVVRSFTERVPFTLISASQRFGTHRSRGCVRHVELARGSDEERLEQLLTLEPPPVGRDVPDVIFPILLDGFQFVARHRDALTQRFVLPRMPSPEGLELGEDKWRFYEFCRDNDLPTPQTWRLPSGEGARQDDAEPSDASFPVLLKRRRGQGGTRSQRFASRGEWQEFLARQCAAGSPGDFLVQRYLRGHDRSLAVYCEDGEIRSYTLWRAEVGGETEYSLPTCVRFGVYDDVDRQIVSIGRALMRRLHWQGLCDIDFLVEGETPWLLEINPRLFGSTPACALAGVDFAKLSYDGALCDAGVDADGRTRVDWPEQKPEIFCDRKGLRKALARPDLRWKLLSRPLRRTSLGFFPRDPLPDLYRISRWARDGLAEALRERSSEPPRRRVRWSHVAGVAFLALQLLSIAYARFAPEKFFCWAPYDQHTFYRLEVAVGGRQLSADEIAQRYRYSASTWEVREIQNVISLVRQYEETYGADDEAVVRMEYETNGHPARTWTWPER